MFAQTSLLMRLSSAAGNDDLYNKFLMGISYALSKSKCTRYDLYVSRTYVVVSISDMHSGKYWQFLAHYKIQILYNFWAQKSKLIFLNGAIFGDFSSFGAKFFTNF